MWEVIFHPAVSQWSEGLDESDRELLEASVNVLKQFGPNLKRPQVGKVDGSKIANLKELRPGSKGRSEIRVLFAFDSKRRAVCLVAGDKRGKWNDWYEKAIPIAESRFEEFENGN